MAFAKSALLGASAVLLALVSGAACASLSLFAPRENHLVRQQQSSTCVLSEDYLSCVKLCDFKNVTCADTKLKVCTSNSAYCSSPDCCANSKVSGLNFTNTVCSKSCCVGINQNGKQVTPASCNVPSGSTGSPSPSISGSAAPTRASPAKSPAATPGTSSAGPGTSGAAAPSNSSASSKCFPAHATVELESGARLRMDELRVGDRVKVGQHTFSDVFLFTHKLEREAAKFVVMQTVSHHKVSMTPGHYVYVTGASLVPAVSVKVGDELTLASGARSAVVSVSQAVYAGVYNPQTLHGDVVVDGIVASTYTTAVSPVLGHASLSPLRALYSALGVTTGLLNGGADYAARLLPSGVHSF